ncbi:MAG: extradiol ring-cleavage dioxygenase [Pseudomonadales bacterium]|nr:extradiol ring-cleavage dioxygenase [Pseudomonadales bacterium]MBL6808056.1 extradiol ring-cleavage dioxygenase [Pseudomonadales bacterium]
MTVATAGTGRIVGAALVSHHPGLAQDEAFRLRAGNGRDSDLIAGYHRLRERLDRATPDTLVIIDTHWFTTGYHLIDAGARYEGQYVSDEMPWYLADRPYAYDGDPELARLCEVVAQERGIMARCADHPALPRHYGTVNLVNALGRGERVLTLSCCQNAQNEHFLAMGAVLGEAIRRSDRRVAILASGALSHKFVPIDWQQVHPRIYHPDNVSSPHHRARDQEAIALLEAGRHRALLEAFARDFRSLPWEALGAHYLQMVGALGGSACRLPGERLSEYENARGTGNIHIWFEGAA